MSIKSKMTALADAIRAKTGDTKQLSIEGMTQAVERIQTGVDIGPLLDGSVTEVTIPSTITSIRQYALYQTSVTSLTIPANIETIGGFAIAYSLIESVTIENANVKWSSSCRSCSALKTINFPNGIKRFDGYAISYTGIESLTIPESTETLDSNCLNGCAKLHTLHIPASVSWIGADVLNRCTALANVTLGDGFNTSGLDLHWCPLTVESMVQMLGALAANTSASTKTLTLGATNLGKLTDEQKAVATDKNWTLA